MAEKSVKKHGIIRKAVQLTSGLMCNANVKGFLTGKIYRGPLKNFCLPGLNCYSCPGALGACPIGALQSFLGGRRRRFSFYILGFLASVGLLAGRFVCGWLCLFGLIQELLYKIPTPKLKLPDRLDRPLRYVKYAVLLLAVIALPLFWRPEAGIGDPFFCKYICPVGTLEGGIPLILKNSGIRSEAGALFNLKMSLLILCLAASVFIYRPFCKYICPLGAFYALFQKVSLFRMHFDAAKCIHCGACSKICKMNVDPTEDPNSCECIRCGDCRKVCPKNALSLSSGSVPK